MKIGHTHTDKTDGPVENSENWAKLATRWFQIPNRWKTIWKIPSKWEENKSSHYHSAVAIWHNFQLKIALCAPICPNHYVIFAKCLWIRLIFHIERDCTLEKYIYVFNVDVVAAADSCQQFPALFGKYQIEHKSSSWNALVKGVALPKEKRMEKGLLRPQLGLVTTSPFPKSVLWFFSSCSTSMLRFYCISEERKSLKEKSKSWYHCR